MLLRVMADRKPQDVAAAMGIHRDTLYKMLQGIRDFPLHLLQPLYEATQDPRVFKAILPQNAYLIFPESQPTNKDICQADAISIKEDADVHSQIAAALSDGIITLDEMVAILRECRESIAAKLLIMKSVELAAEHNKKKKEEEQLCLT